VGVTSRCICERCEQHKKDLKAIAKKPKKTALVAHVNETKHEFDFDGVKVLKKVRTKGLLYIHEANQIILHEDVAVNFRKDAKHVSPIVYNLIKSMEDDKTRKSIKQTRRTFNVLETENVPPGQTPSEHSLNDDSFGDTELRWMNYDR